MISPLLREEDFSARSCRHIALVRAGCNLLHEMEEGFDDPEARPAAASARRCGR